MHEDWDVEAYTIGWALNENLIYQTVVPTVWSKKSDILISMIENKDLEQDVKPLVVNKLKFTLKQLEDVSKLENLQEAREKANVIFEMCEEWLKDSPYLLGENYTMADVLFQTMLWRCSWTTDYFAKYALSKPNVRRYFEEFRASEDFKKANFFGPGATQRPMPTNC